MIAFSIKGRVLIGLIGPPIGPIGPIGGPIRPARGGVALSPVIEPHGCLTKLKGWWYASFMVLPEKGDPLLQFQFFLQLM
jgi:hypothetical protein